MLVKNIYKIAGVNLPIDRSLSLNKNETEKKSKSTFSSSRALIMSAERTGISEINYYSWTMYESQKVLLIGKQLNKFEDTKTVGYNKQIE